MAQESLAYYPERVNVSVIVPFKDLNSGESLLTSLLDQEYSENYEIIFVEGGNIAQARNKGLEESSGELIAFVDSDCIVENDWLLKIVSKITDLRADGVCGPGISPTGEGLFSTAIDCVYDSFLGSLGSSSLKIPKNIHKTDSLSTHNCVFTRKSLLSVGGFDEKYDMNEDSDLSNRLRANRNELYVSPEPVVYHFRKKTLSAFANKFFRYGVSRTRAVLTDTRNFDIKTKAMLLIALIISTASLLYQRFLVFIMFFYVSLLLIHGLYYAIKRRRLAYLIQIPVLYLVEHTSYAFGLILGLSKGRYRNKIDKPVHRVHKEVRLSK